MRSIAGSRAVSPSGWRSRWRASPSRRSECGIDSENGVTIFGPTCNVNRVDNYSANDSTGTYEYDGKGEAEGAPEFINVNHIVAVVETYYQYGCSLDYGARLTAV